MKYKLLIFLFFINYGYVFGQSTKSEKIDSLLRAANKIGIFNGNIIVSENRRIIYQNEIGFTDFTKNKELSKESQMPIGSIAKEFNSTGILLLVEKGKIKLEDKVSIYVNNLPSWANQIQIKHLLQYSSGLPRIFKNSEAEYWQELQKVEKLEFEPGTGYIYSNANVFLQQKIIEKVSQLSYPDFLKKSLFRILKIKGGLIPKDSILSKDMVGSFDNDFNETTFIHGGGEMYFTISDLYNWVYGLHHNKLISNQSLLILGNSFDKNSESSLGNVVTDDKHIIERIHEGSGNNYESLIYYKADNEIFVVILTNNQNFKLSEITESILNILDGKPFYLPKKSIYLDIRGKLLDDFTTGLDYYNFIKTTEKEKYDFTNEVSDLISTAKYLMRRNKFENAIKILEICTTLDSKNTSSISTAYSLIGECYYKTDKNDLAISNLKKAIALDAENKNAEEMLKRMEKE